MALLFAEGFEWLGSSTTYDQATPQLLKIWNAVDIATGASSAFSTSRTGYHGLNFVSGDNIRSPKLRAANDSDTTCIFGFYLETGTSLNDSVTILELYAGAAVQCSFQMNSTGTVDFYRGATNLLGTSTFTFSTSNKYFVEFKIVIADGTSGSMEMKVADITADGDDAITISEWTISSVDTRQLTGSYQSSWDEVRFYAWSISGTTVYDDIYICDSSGSIRNDFLGNLVIETIDPSGAGSSTQLTPSAGSNWQNVDESLVDDDTTYNTADANGELDLYAATNTSASGDVLGVVPTAFARVTQGDPRKCKLAIKSGSTTDLGDSITVASDEYVARWRVIEQNPDDSQDFTTTDVDALEIGFKRDS